MYYRARGRYIFIKDNLRINISSLKDFIFKIYKMKILKYRSMKYLFVDTNLNFEQKF